VPVREVRSSKFRRVCYRINILGSQLHSCLHYCRGLITEL